MKLADSGKAIDDPEEEPKEAGCDPNPVPSPPGKSNPAGRLLPISTFLFLDPPLDDGEGPALIPRAPILEGKLGKFIL